MFQTPAAAKLLSVHLAAGRSTIVTMAAIQQQDGVEFAPVGLTNMMNCGGAVLDLALSAAGPGSNGDSSAVTATMQVGTAVSLVRACQTGSERVTPAGV